MRSGCKILWTDHALGELAKADDYLGLHFTELELKKLSVEMKEL